jgi:oxepin-CoA hydrolase / 3-oxo-5,6-dehydrosuberyl-CoA semialdehyde dehydrogenase
MNAPARPPRRLESYVCGSWTLGAKEGPALLDAATGDPVAYIDSSGLDFAAVLEHGRRAAGPKLRAMSFHDRAGMLKALGLALMAMLRAASAPC